MRSDGIMDTAPEKLTEQILKDADNRSKPILRRARRRAEEIVEEAKDDARATREKWREEAEQKVEAERERTIARTRLEVENVHRRGREKILSAARERAKDSLRDFCEKSEYRQSLADLVRESIQSMTGEQFEVLLTERDHDTLGMELIRQLDDQMAEQVAPGPPVRGKDIIGGAIIRRVDRTQICDESYRSRLQRLWPDLRQRVAAILLEDR